MATRPHDAIVIGARCAGSPTAMLLARRGHRVLLVDRATFPSDTISTHLIHPPGIAALRRWGLLEQVVATGCPPIDTYSFDFGAFTIEGSPAMAEEPVAYAPRRTVLDEILVDAAVAAGAEVRTGFVVEELLVEQGRVAGVRGHGTGVPTVTERARVVVGADGLHSLVARTVAPPAYAERPPLNASYYTYWSDLPMDGRFETGIRPGRGFAAWPTNDGLTLVICGWPYAEFEERRHDIEGNYRETIAGFPGFAERLRRARREERFAGMGVPNWFRKPFGPGWVLVGDAGYNKDFITAQGIQDAFRDAESCAAALDAALSGARPFDVALAEYHEQRDGHVRGMYEFTCQLATLSPPPPGVQKILAATAGNTSAMDGFARVAAGVTPPPEFFSEENVGRILAAAR